MLSRSIVLALPLLLRTERWGDNGDRGKKSCRGKEIVVGREKGAGESLGGRAIVLDSRAKKRSSMSEDEELSIWSPTVETGFVIVVIASFDISFGESSLAGFIEALL